MPMKWVNRFFVFLGVVFFLILLALSYFIIVDPFNIRPFISSAIIKDYNGVNTSNPEADFNNPGVVTENNSVSESSTTSGINLSNTQKKVLELVGVDPETLPTKLTPEQEACFVSTLGQDRVDDIVAGAAPTAAEFLKAKHCIE